jgi:hypothetical protein
MYFRQKKKTIEKNKYRQFHVIWYREVSVTTMRARVHLLFGGACVWPETAAEVAAELQELPSLGCRTCEHFKSTDTIAASVRGVEV